MMMMQKLAARARALSAGPARAEDTEPGRESPDADLVHRELASDRRPGAAVKIAQLLSRVLPSARAHRDWRVRQAAVKAAGNFLRFCARTFADSKSLLLETLVLGVADDEDSVALSASEALTALRSREGEAGSSWPEVVQVLRSNLSAVLGTMPKRFFGHPRRHSAGGEQSGAVALTLATAYISLLGKEGLAPILDVSLPKIMTGLLAIARFEPEDRQAVVEECALAEYGHDYVQPVPVGVARRQDCALASAEFVRKRHFYLHEDRTATLFRNLCRLLGYFGRLEQLMDFLMDYIASRGASGAEQEHEADRSGFGAALPPPMVAEALYICNNVLLGSASIGIEELVVRTKVIGRSPAPSGEQQPDLSQFWATGSGAAANTLETVASVATSLLRVIVDMDYLNAPGDPRRHAGDARETAARGGLIGLERRELAMVDYRNGAQAPNVPFSLIPRRHRNPPCDTSSAHSRLLTTALAMEAIYAAARVQGQRFCPLLLVALYPILDALGQPNRPLAHAAGRALEGVSRACGYPDASACLLANADYLVNAVSRRLRRLSANPGAVRVFASAVRVAGKGAVGFLAESVEEVLDALEAHHHQDPKITEDLVGALLEVARAVHDACVTREEDAGETSPAACPSPNGHVSPGRSTWPARLFSQRTPAEDVSPCARDFIRNFATLEEPRVSLFPRSVDKEVPDTVPAPSEAEGRKRMEEICRYFLDKRERERMEGNSDLDDVDLRDDGRSRDDLTEEDQSPEESGGRAAAADGDDRQPPPTPAQRLALDIIGDLHHHLSSSWSALIRTASLRAIALLVFPALADRQRDVFPMMHKIWPSIVRRASPEHEANPNASAAALELLLALAEFDGRIVGSADNACGGPGSGFLGRRFMEDAWPAVKAWLRRRSPAARADAGVNPLGERFTSAYRLRLLCLRVVGRVIETGAVRPVHHADVRAVCSEVAACLCARCHDAQTRSAALEVLRALADAGFSDEVWLTALGMGKVALPLWGEGLDLAEEPIFGGSGKVVSPQVRVCPPWQRPSVCCARVVCAACSPKPPLVDECEGLRLAQIVGLE